MKIMLGFCCLLLLLNGCAKEKNWNAGKYHLKGKVEKGPFEKGSQVMLYELDEQLQRTGVSFRLQIADNTGTFDFGGVDIGSPYIELVATGCFYNEVTGMSTFKPITLRALADLSVQRNVNVNVLTHLESERIEVLKEEGMSFKSAEEQARKEVLTAFGLQRFEKEKINTFSLADGANGAGILSVVSASLLRDRSVETLDVPLLVLSKELAKNGRLRDETKEEFRKGMIETDWGQVSRQLVQKYQECGQKITLPELEYFVDWDGDGEAGNEVEYIEGKKVRFAMDTLYVASEGGEYTVDIIASISYDFTETPSEDELPKNEMEAEGLFEFESVKMNLTTTLDKVNNRLKVVVRPAEGYWIRKEQIELSGNNGLAKARLVICQEGDQKKFVLPQGLQDALKGILVKIRNACDYLYTIESYYTRCFPEPANDWQKFYLHEKTLVNSEELSKAWGEAYNAIADINSVCERLENHEIGDLCVPVFKTLRSVMYYPLWILWGNIPYPEHISLATSQLKEREVYEKLIGEVEENYKLLWDLNLPYGEDYWWTNSLLLGKVYMQMGEYAKAKQWVERVINSQKYTLESSRQQALNLGSSELILGLDLEGTSSVYKDEIRNYRYLPVGTYGEALLLMSECYWHLEQKGEALDCLNKVRTAYGLPVAGEVDQFLKDTWKELLKGEFSYFAFLKRNDWCESELGIESYQKLLPLPESEITFGKAEQNPGY